MKIGIVGATGKAGSLILDEAVRRGHEVTAIVRNASKLNNDNVKVIEKDVHDTWTEDFKGLDVVVNAFGAPLGEKDAHVEAGRVLINALSGTGIRLIVVGGAGSLYVDDSRTMKVIDTPNFPDIFKPTAGGQSENLEELEQTTNLKWTFISPSAEFDAEGKRTGAYETGADVLLVNKSEESYISYADFAIAVIDEAENAEHVNERFTVVAEKE
ncbi:NAD(P)-dependent oxidoreductase [Jeotgalicoccus halotolerans]|jgi:Putative NADH-flavin reductase|uniref:NAD(P)-dependent oxidoreductase n=1 Tax=Jeotgalicoccus nanhaiensis TaxID=568603 RepID=A0ABR9XZC0_9STAP|nr:NAD(P)-dependent oxidoreductase [Jeotgalicoccus nanhaiensis]MBF0754252.1 NAD(P)-dependent oxidoreductase [Jeotgalicoccus nanhaiensis]TFU61433.1 NAD(P)-dependent oxidoreductase [Jeotgalicoccus nanhaiensis]